MLRSFFAKKGISGTEQRLGILRYSESRSLQRSLRRPARSQKLSKMDNLPLLGNPKNIGQNNCFEPYEQDYGQEEQYYHLKWHNHQSNLTFELAELQQFETFVDVTLSTMDGNSINCHKVCKQLKYLVLDLPGPQMKCRPEKGGKLNTSQAGSVEASRAAVGQFLSISHEAFILRTR